MEKISLIVPCYNEEQVIEIFYKETKKVLKKLEKEYLYEFIFIDDGSKDNTLSILKQMREKDNNINIISFSRNFGKEAAMYAGLNNSTGELIVIMDADLQHPPKVILEMIEGIKEGYDTVTTQRVNRRGEPVIKSAFSKMFYKVMSKFVDFELVQGAQDFRMMKREVVDAIISLKEYNRFSKGIFSWVGFKVKYIQVENTERAAGNTKWSFKSLLKYAMEGMLSFSTKPLRISTILGLLISFIAFISTCIIIIQTLVLGKEVPGYASIITTVLFMGGVQLISLGIIAEYISKMYLEIKNRPKYIIREKIYKK
ncbi:MAG: glycosyltransferase family 2 protein [Clostridia bacterium]|nr:glycosyltransferase family 2 protein [Clostridia bacterium]